MNEGNISNKNLPGKELPNTNLVVGTTNRVDTVNLSVDLPSTQKTTMAGTKH